MTPAAALATALRGVGLVGPVEALAARQLARLRAAGFDVVAAMPAAGLTPRQRDCQMAIERAVDATGVAPSLREIGARLGIAHSGVHRIVAALAARGWVRLTHHRARAVTLLRRLPDTIAEGEA